VAQHCNGSGAAKKNYAKLAIDYKIRRTAHTVAGLLWTPSQKSTHFVVARIIS
jgi:hypothetical protein